MMEITLVEPSEDRPFVNVTFTKREAKELVDTLCKTDRHYDLYKTLHDLLYR